MKLRELKINEVINAPDIRERNVRRLNKHYYKSSDDREPQKITSDAPKLARRRQHLGTGGFASTYADDKNPHDVLKTSRKMAAPEVPRGDIDGFYFYAKAIADSDDKDNPYFPRIRNMRVYRNGDRMTYSAQIERLTDLYKLSDQELDAIWLRCFNHEPPAAGTTYEKADDLAGALEAIGEMGSGDKVVDDDLRRALKLIHQLRRQHWLDVDLHAGNIMVRRGPHGNQLVLTDPIGYRKDADMNKRTPN